MQEIWAQIDNWLKINAPQVFEVLQSGVSDDEISELEKLLSIQLPEDVKASYRIHNGQSDFSYGLIEGREFLSLERIKEEWQIWKDLLDSETFQDDGVDQGCNPELGIINVWWSAKWLPITYDGGGNHDCLDLNPAEGGTVGQIITMWHDDAERKIVAPSFRIWLQKYAEGLASGQLVFSEEYGGIVNVDDV
ncbi:MAG: molybdenum cofactor biosynthesis protein MoeA [Pseudanabaena frigida]|uniref:Molybdenum cofactor biosynthesis protein MoeA n=1 Tax=Pseudanabaena frigida TaxID=945775 RepID=A0A2W4WLP7_9CYAN|nr:MAG: molybdenum cofactor biosynthesis protein MoeA [Pseudanabaena frigida]